MRLVWMTALEETPALGGCEYPFLDNGDEIVLPCLTGYPVSSCRFSFDKQSGAYRQEPAEEIPSKQTILFPQQARAGGRIVREKSVNIVECVEDGRQVWRMRHQAYLYTPFTVRNGCVLFGTAGMGGRFYCVDMDSGKVLCDLDTGDTSFYDWHGDTAVLFDRRRLVRVDPFSGRIVDEMPIPRGFPYHAALNVFDGSVYAVLLSSRYRASIFRVDL